MKSHVGQSNLLRIPATSYVQRRRQGDCVKERAMTDAVLIVALVATILALYAAMFVGVYRWSHYDPLLPPESAAIARPATS
jgi:hypothetical protein